MPKTGEKMDVQHPSMDVQQASKGTMDVQQELLHVEQAYLGRKARNEG